MQQEFQTGALGAFRQLGSHAVQNIVIVYPLRWHLGQTGTVVLINGGLPIPATGRTAKVLGHRRILIPLPDKVSGYGGTQAAGTSRGIQVLQITAQRNAQLRDVTQPRYGRIQVPDGWGVEGCPYNEDHDGVEIQR
jgi:hypothetical protein